VAPETLVFSFTSRHPDPFVLALLGGVSKIRTAARGLIAVGVARIASDVPETGGAALGFLV